MATPSNVKKERVGPIADFLLFKTVSNTAADDDGLMSVKEEHFNNGFKSMP